MSWYRLWTRTPNQLIKSKATRNFQSIFRKLLITCSRSLGSVILVNQIKHLVQAFCPKKTIFAELLNKLVQKKRHCSLKQCPKRYICYWLVAVLDFVKPSEYFQYTISSGVPRHCSLYSPSPTIALISCHPLSKIAVGGNSISRVAFACLASCFIYDVAVDTNESPKIILNNSSRLYLPSVSLIISVLALVTPNTKPSLYFKPLSLLLFAFAFL